MGRKWCKLTINPLHHILVLTHQQQTAYIKRKREIARNEQFLLFPRCFLLNQVIVSLIRQYFLILSLFAAELEDPKIGISGKGLTLKTPKIAKSK